MNELKEILSEREARDAVDAAFADVKDGDGWMAAVWKITEGGAVVMETVTWKFPSRWDEVKDTLLDDIRKRRDAGNVPPPLPKAFPTLVAGDTPRLVRLPSVDGLATEGFKAPSEMITDRPREDDDAPKAD